MRRASLILGVVLLGIGGAWVHAGVPTASGNARPCPDAMVHVNRFCIDRYEVVTVDETTSEPLSPYYPPERQWYSFVLQAWDVLRLRVGSPEARRMPLPPLSEWQLNHDPAPKAVSKQGAIPQGYLSYFSAKRACARAGKRLCSDEEWKTACRGEHGTPFPYGESYKAEPCNVSKKQHPAAVLHGLASSGHLDPRLNLLVLDGDAPVLRVTGASQACASRFGNDAVYDMVGNLDEWVEDETGVFRGGFYARRSHRGCDAQITTHAPTYFDYSTGARCCMDAGGQ